MEHRFIKTYEGCDAVTDNEQLLFGVLLSEEVQLVSVVDELLRLVAVAQARPEVELNWRGRHYVLSLLQGEVTLAHISDVVSEDDFAEQMDSEGFGEVRQESVAGVEDLRELLMAWREFIGA